MKSKENGSGVIIASRCLFIPIVICGFLPCLEPQTVLNNFNARTGIFSQAALAAPFVKALTRTINIAHFDISFMALMSIRSCFSVRFYKRVQAVQ